MRREGRKDREREEVGREEEWRVGKGEVEKEVEREREEGE